MLLCRIVLDVSLGIGHVDLVYRERAIGWLDSCLALDELAVLMMRAEDKKVRKGHIWNAHNFIHSAASSMVHV